MAAQRTTFEKLQRDRAKKAKAAMKRERKREGRGPDDVAEAAEPAPLSSGTGELSAAELLDRIERIHRDRQLGTLSEEDFEEQKADLLSRLSVD